MQQEVGILAIFMLLFKLPNEIFERDGRDLYFEAPIPFEIAVLGGTINVPGLESKIALKIPSYTQTGKIFQNQRKGSCFCSRFTKR